MACLSPQINRELQSISLTEGGRRIVVKALTMRLRPFFAEATRLCRSMPILLVENEHAVARALHHHTLASDRLTLKERKATGNKPTSDHPLH